MEGDLIEAEDYLDVTKQFEAGVPALAVDLEYFRSVWQNTADYREYAKDDPVTSISATVMGVNDGVHTTEQAFAVWIRSMLLDALVQRGVLPGNGATPLPEAVLVAAATMPCDKTDIAEALILRHLLKAPAEEVVWFRHEAAMNGYDPEHPCIDAKFLAWLRRVQR